MALSLVLQDLDLMPSSAINLQHGQEEGTAFSPTVSLQLVKWRHYFPLCWKRDTNTCKDLGGPALEEATEKQN